MQLTRRWLLSIAATLPFADVAFAQPKAMRRVRGRIDSVKADSLSLTMRSGQTVTVTVPENARLTEIAPIDVSAIKPGSFIGTAAVTQPDGSLKAREIQVFPESMRGVGEGHHPWDLGTNSTMTNGTVGDLKVANGRTLTLTYKGGQQTVFVPPNAPVITYLPATRALLKRGANVIIFASEGPDDSLTASSVGIGKDGLVPPM